MPRRSASTTSKRTLTRAQARGQSAIHSPPKKRKRHHATIEDESDSEREDQYQPHTASSSSPSESESSPERQTAHPARSTTANSLRQPLSTNVPPATSKDSISQAVLPTIHNYTTFCTNWTDAYIDKLIAHRKQFSNNRPPPEVLFEAQALQHQYNRNKKLLTLVGDVSLNTLEEHLSVFFCHSSMVEFTN